MAITSTTLTRAAGAAAAVAGAIFIAVQINHPASDTFTTETTQWVVRECAKIVMAVLALAGITGMYLRQYRKAGLLGLVGYLVFAIGYLAMLSTEVIAAVVLPSLVDSEPGFVNDVVAAANGGVANGDIGGLQILFGLMGAGLIVGGVVFGIAAVPRTGPCPLGGRPARRQHRGLGRARSAAGVVQPAARRPRRHGAHRPGCVPVAQC